MVVTQPPFIYYSGERYLATVPPPDLPWLYALASLRAQGIRVAASSDAPVVPFPPLVGICAAVTRKAASGQDLLPHEGITPLEALKSYTIDAAYASFDDREQRVDRPGEAGGPGRPERRPGAGAAGADQGCPGDGHDPRRRNRLEEVSRLDYQAAVEYILGFADYERASRTAVVFNTSRMEALLESLGKPHLAASSVHIAGTKGKGSTAAMIASILTASGRRTGLYTSPHLHSFTERIRIDGHPIPEERVRRAGPEAQARFRGFQPAGGTRRADHLRDPDGPGLRPLRGEAG